MNILRYDINRIAMVVAVVTIVSLIGVLGSAILTPKAQAALTDTADFSQVINNGALAVEIRSDNTTPVASPDYGLAAVTFDFDCQTATGTNVLGDAAERIYVDDATTTGTGWTLTIAATGGTTATWQNIAPDQYYDFNDDGTMPTCAEGLDSDSYAGRLTVDPSVGSWTAACTGCDTSGLTVGASNSFQEVATAVTDITIGISDGTQVTGRWYFTGGTLSQTIPGNQAADTYTIGMTITGATA